MFKKLVITLCLGSFFCTSQETLSLEASWQSERVQFNYLLQARNPWWGCRNAEPMVERALELFEAQNINLFCDDNQGRGLPEVRFWIQFDRLSTNTETNGEIVEALWKSLSFSSNQLCGFHSALIDKLLPHFEVSNKTLMSSCTGEDGQVYLQADFLAPNDN